MILKKCVNINVLRPMAAVIFPKQYSNTKMNKTGVMLVCIAGLYFVVCDVAAASVKVSSLPPHARTKRQFGGLISGITGAIGSVTGTISSVVTDPIGSLTGAIGSVIGNPFEAITGAIGSVVSNLGMLTGVTYILRLVLDLLRIAGLGFFSSIIESLLGLSDP